MNRVSLLAVGDISLITKNNKHPFEPLLEIFKEKDILFGNLETVLSNREAALEKSVTLHASPEDVRYLKDAGFNVLNVANNHILDLGKGGFSDTLDMLKENGISFVGGGNKKYNQTHAIIDANGVSLGFLGYYTYGFSYRGIIINGIDEKEVIRDIANLKTACNVVVVSLHWGIENVFYPSPEQIEGARSFIDAGAAIVLGHHPHVVQGVEEYGGGLIAYSLGNFQFPFNSEACSAKIDMKTDLAIMLDLNIEKNGLESYEIIPIRIDDCFVPYLCNEQQRENMMALISAITRPITNGRLDRRVWFEEIAGEYLAGNWQSFLLRIKRFGGVHIWQFIKWLVSPFVLKCYLACIRKKIAGQKFGHYLF